MSEYVTTIGLEVHAELRTNTKMFCSCPVAFGGQPNTRVCPVCLGLPGSLPVPNERAIEYTMKIALALGCEVAPHSVFHRKNYFYPDMPKNYQISQYDLPIGVRGLLDVEVDGATRTIGITRVHLEEDTGKTIHMGGEGRIHEADYALEDFNRAGTPLIEIVSEPDLTSAEEARTFAQEVRTILDYLEVSDVRMEEGSLRVDANISVAAPGQEGVKAEVKNMNSMRSVYRALAYEENRQRKALDAGETLDQATLHWDENAGVTTPGRAKEYSSDYRYFPDPDLVPVEPSVEWLRQLREEIPELPAERRSRLVSDGLTALDARALTSSKAAGDFFEAAMRAASADAKQVANWVANNLVGALEEGDDLSNLKVTPEAFASLVDLVDSGKISGTQGKEVLVEMLRSGRDASSIVAEKGIEQISDRAELETVVDEVVAANPEVAGKIRAGEPKAVGFLVGQVMKATKGQANPALVNEILRDRLKG